CRGRLDADGTYRPHWESHSCLRSPVASGSAPSGTPHTAIRAPVIGLDREQPCLVPGISRTCSHSSIFAASLCSAASRLDDPFGHQEAGIRDERSGNPCELAHL